jgi:ABC-type transport system involved in Fe-S cluster assembly fused permease/ATPase subunit
VCTRGLVVINLLPYAALQTAEAKFEKLMKAAYARAANVAGEALGSFKTVTAFGGARLEVTKYGNNLATAEAAGKKKAMGTGLGMVGSLPPPPISQ